MGLEGGQDCSVSFEEIRGVNNVGNRSVTNAPLLRETRAVAVVSCLESFSGAEGSPGLYGCFVEVVWWDSVGSPLLIWFEGGVAGRLGVASLIVCRR
jgi:hypothetical protein